MLLRSSSTPLFLHSFHSSHSSLHLRRAISDSHLPSLHLSSSTPNEDISSNTGQTTGLRTELSLSIYNTFCNKQGDPLASQQPGHQGHHEEEQEQEQWTVQPEQPELPLFLARGLGIDRIASGFFTAGAAKPKQAAAASMEERMQEEKVAALDAQYKNMVDEQPGNALFLRNYAHFLHEVKGDPRRAEEYYSRAMLADPRDGEIMSQYAKLIWEVYQDGERSLSYFQKSAQAAPDNSHVLAAYASFLWEQDDDDFGDGEQGTGGGAAPKGRAAGAGQARELATVAV